MSYYNTVTDHAKKSAKQKGFGILVAKSIFGVSFGRIIYNPKTVLNQLEIVCCIGKYNKEKSLKQMINFCESPQFPTGRVFLVDTVNNSIYAVLFHSGKPILEEKQINDLCLFIEGYKPTLPLKE